MTAPERYPTKVFWNDEDEGFIALAPDLPGCSAFGETQLEALDAIKHAIVAWQQAAAAAGNPVPEPSRPELESAYSGKLLLRVPKRLHAAAAEAAKNEGVSLNQFVGIALATYVSRAPVAPAIFIQQQGGPVQIIASPLQPYPNGFYSPLLDLSTRAKTDHTLIATRPEHHVDAETLHG